MKRFQGRIPLVNTFGKASLHPVDGTPVRRSLSRWRRGDGMNRHELHACGAFVAVDVVAAGRWMSGE